MTNFGAGYDAWLEAPYTSRAAAADFADQAIEAYAANFGLEVDEVSEDEAIDWYIDEQEDARISAHESDVYDDWKDREFFGED